MVLDAEEPLGVLVDAAEVVVGGVPRSAATSDLVPSVARLPGTVGAGGLIELDIDALLADPRLRVAVARRRPRPLASEQLVPRPPALDPDGGPP